jgi:hypothetical protein
MAPLSQIYIAIMRKHATERGITNKQLKGVAAGIYGAFYIFSGVVPREGTDAGPTFKFTILGAINKSGRIEFITAPFIQIYSFIF